MVPQGGRARGAGGATGRTGGPATAASAKTVPPRPATDRVPFGPDTVTALGPERVTETFSCK